VVEGLSTFSRDMNKINSKIGDVAKTAAKAAIGGIAAIGAGITAIGAASLKSAISFESAFAGVIKTTDGLTDEFGDLTEMGEEMRQGFRDLSKEIPTTIEELTAIGEIGGQLGIAADDLLDFTEVISAMGVATNLTTEEAAVQFAQLANIMGTVEREGSDAFGKLGSTIVALGNNFATTEADVSNFASRIAGAGAIAGLAESDVLAIGAAMSSVGVQAEAGGTAVQKVLLNINEAVLTGSDDLETFAATAGLSATEFADLWEKDAAEALTLFVEGLGVAGDEAIFVLEELGLTDQRLTRSFLSLAGAGDLLRETVELSSEAWEENSALSKEADQRYATTESQIQLLKNTFNDLAITIGDILLPMFNQALDAARPFIENLTAWLSENLPIAIQAASDFFNNTLLPALTSLWDFITANIIPALTNLWAWFQETLPAAMQTISTFYEETLKPVLVDLVDWVVAFVTEHGEGLKAALIAIGAVLAGAAIVTGIISIAGAIAALVNPITLIIGAIALLAAAWTEDWGGIRTTITAWWEETGKPIFEALKLWLEENIPIAIGILKTFWEETLLPALATVWTFITETLIPVFETIVLWLAENIPVAIETMKVFWEETLKPALETVWMFITENIIPVFETVVAWLSENIPIAIEIVRKAWEEILKPAIELVWTFIEEDLFPLLESLKEFFEVAFTLAITALAGLWENVLEPAIKIVWEMIKDNILPILGDLEDFWNNTLKPILEDFAELVGTTLKAAWEDFNVVVEWSKINILDPLKNTLDSIKDAFGKVKDAIDKVTEKLKGIKLPDWLVPGSPTPLELGLRGIGNAFEDLSVDKIPAFQDALQSMGRIGKTAGGLLGQEIEGIDEEVAQVNEKIEGMWAILERMESGELPDVLKLDLIRDINAQEAERNRLLGERLQAEEKIAMLQRQQQQIEFLQQQTELLDIIRQNQLNAAEILGGLELGIDASATDVADAMIRAMQAMVARTQEELGIASPSSVFARIGEQIAEGLAMGIQRGGGAVSQIAAQTMSASPTSSTAVNNTFNTTINSGMDQAFFEQQVLQTVSGALP
jgi:TP901 family phage tail tape measure protein